MITKDHLRDSMTRECDIILHLHGKLTPESMSYRPTPGQRSTLELLQYLAVVGIASCTCMAKGSWDLYKEYGARVKDMKPEDFPKLMNQQKQELTELFASLTEEQMTTQEAPLPGGGGTAPLGLAIFNGPQKWLSAYKLQLFLYAKANGADEINTANAWAGVDRWPAATS